VEKSKQNKEEQGGRRGEEGKGSMKAFLGPAGSYSHEAAAAYFGEAELKAVASFADVFEEARAGNGGLVPIENSSHGSVVQVLDLFLEVGGVVVVDEVYARVRHCLVCRGGMESITTVVSHPQAIGQCTHFLRKTLPHVDVLEVASTSLAAQMASKDPSVAGISSQFAAERYNVRCLAKDIQDSQDNTTRFFVLASQLAVPVEKDAKTVILFTVPHRSPGALCDTLRLFKDHGLDLWSIQSRPSGNSLWQYAFYVECSGSLEDEAVQQTVAAMRTICLHVRILGSFPDQRPPATSYI